MGKEYLGILGSRGFSIFLIFFFQEGFEKREKKETISKFKMKHTGTVGEPEGTGVRDPMLNIRSPVWYSLVKQFVHFFLSGLVGIWLPLCSL